MLLRRLGHLSGALIAHIERLEELGVVEGEPSREVAEIADRIRAQFPILE